MLLWVCQFLLHPTPGAAAQVRTLLFFKTHLALLIQSVVTPRYPLFAKGEITKYFQKAELQLKNLLGFPGHLKPASHTYRPGPVLSSGCPASFHPPQGATCSKHVPFVWTLWGQDMVVFLLKCTFFPSHLLKSHLSLTFLLYCFFSLRPACSCPPSRPSTFQPPKSQRASHNPVISGSPSPSKSRPCYFLDQNIDPT